MRILALDLGRRMGVADGDSAWLTGRADDTRRIPSIETVTLRGMSAEKRVGYLAHWLDKRASLSRRGIIHPDLIVTESPMNPAASKSDNATIDQLGYYFCLHTLAALFEIKIEAVPVMAVRKHFCGVACAPPVRGHKRTAKEAEAARKFINEMVLARAILLGYLPEGSTDWD